MVVKKRKVPMRKCVISGEMKPKGDMVRVVRSKEDGVSIDTTGKKNGRGAYVSIDPDLIQEAKQKDLLSRALNTQVPQEFYDELQEHIEYTKARAELLNEQ